MTLRKDIEKPKNDCHIILNLEKRFKCGKCSRLGTCKYYVYKERDKQWIEWIKERLEKISQCYISVPEPSSKARVNVVDKDDIDTLITELSGEK